NNTSSFNWIISQDSSHIPTSSNKIRIVAGRNKVIGKVLEINSKGCNSDTAKFDLSVDLKPTTSLVSNDSVSIVKYCITSNTKKMTGNIPGIGTGSWRILKNPDNAVIDLTNPISPINGFDKILDTLVAEWRIDNGSCPTSISRLTILPIPALIPQVYLKGETNSCKGAPVSFKAIPIQATGTNPTYSFYDENNQLLRAKNFDSVYTFNADQSTVIYAVVHSDYPCLYVDSAKTPIQKLDVVAKLKASILQNGDTICEDKPPIILNAFDNKINGITYEWLHNGIIVKQSSSPEKLVLNSPDATGKYELKVYNNTCVPDQSAWNVKIYDKPDLFLIPEMEVEYMEGKETEIPLSVNSLYDSNDSLTIKWDKTENLFYYSGLPVERKNLTYDVSVQNPVYVPRQQDFSLTYSATVTSSKKFHCSTSASIKVYNFILANIPNAFSPNGDGLNDTWIIKGLIKYPNTKITVFNRWGNMVYENKLGHNEPWDGTIHGTILTTGTYYYIIEFNGSQDKSDHKVNGSVTLV
ncbi:MAG: gliding motility-associated C-terminal domain-containing protein, partial [Opitutaceae bacterium]|nr:gliding motility-associated C-terminal domain-containing protein [Cytophagales bacterium]